jgi:hypothetical protein
VSCNHSGSWYVFSNQFFKKMKKKFRFRFYVRCGTNGGGDCYVWCVCCHKGRWCIVTSHCSKLGSLNHVFVSFIFLHNTVVTVHIFVLVFASQLFQNWLGKVDFLTQHIFCFVHSVPIPNGRACSVSFECLVERLRAKGR